MIGSTMIAENSPSRLATIRCADDLDGFVLVELDVMTTLDFELLTTEAGLDWTDGDPIVFDPDGGWRFLGSTRLH